jgi:hypothetical protein
MAAWSAACVAAVALVYAAFLVSAVTAPVALMTVSVNPGIPFH